MTLYMGCPTGYEGLAMALQAPSCGPEWTLITDRGASR